MMDYRENAGYLITDSCHVGESEFVLGVHLTEPHQFVTWKCTNQTDYYWGHYFSDLFSAQKDFVARAQEEVQYLEEYRQNVTAFQTPSDSPWGEIQECKTLCPGAYSVSTEGHGGIMVSRKLAEKVFRKEAESCGFTEGAYLCFEEDCDAQVALRELMDKSCFKRLSMSTFLLASTRLSSMKVCALFTRSIGKCGKRVWREKIRQTKQRDKGNDR